MTVKKRNDSKKGEMMLCKKGCSEKREMTVKKINDSKKD